MSDKKKIAFVGNTSFSMYNFRLGVMRHFMEDYEVVVIAPEDEYSIFFEKEGMIFKCIWKKRCKGWNPD